MTTPDARLAEIRQLLNELEWTHDAGVTACHYPGNDEPCTADDHYHTDRGEVRMLLNMLLQQVESLTAALDAERAKREEQDRLLDAFDDGQAAALKGLPQSSNPHDPGDSYGVPTITQLWDDGWICCANRKLETDLREARAALQVSQQEVADLRADRLWNEPTPLPAS